MNLKALSGKHQIYSCCSTIDLFLYMVRVDMRDKKYLRSFIAVSEIVHHPYSTRLLTKIFDVSVEFHLICKDSLLCHHKGERLDKFNSYFLPP